VRLLLQSGADSRVSDPFGKRPADRKKDPAIIRMLRDARNTLARVPLRNSSPPPRGKTPCDNRGGLAIVCRQGKRKLSTGVTAYHTQRLLFLQELEELEPRK
jgi:hypothetical protein